MISGGSVMTRSDPCALWQVAVGCSNTRPLRCHDAPRRESASTGLSTGTVCERERMFSPRSVENDCLTY
jgi:hypothetical protein